MEHDHYMQLRRQRHDGTIPRWTDDDVLREEARLFALESCREASARWNAKHG